jgi:radical SAM enzyme (TIGR01210 family)
MKPEYLDLKKEITRLVMAARSTSQTDKGENPRFISYDRIIRPNGRQVGRKKVILMTHGCSVPTCTMCPFTNENHYSNFKDVNIDLLRQVQDVLVKTKDEPSYKVLALYNDGSFFAPSEIADYIRDEIAQIVSCSDIDELVVESLPQFITEQRIETFVNQLGEVHLEVGIGLQSSNSFIREVCVNTSFSNKCFEKAIEILLSLGVTPKIYLMIKPPFLSEEEAIADTLKSIEYVSDLGLNNVTLCPTRVAKNTLAWDMYHANLYFPPNLWSIVDILKEGGSKTQLRVACINLMGSDFESIFPNSCDKCKPLILESIEQFSLSGDLECLPEFCNCRTSYNIQDVIDSFDEKNLESKVRNTLEIFNKNELKV